MKYVRKIETEMMLMDGSTVILHLEQHTVTKLNELGSLVWTVLDTPKDLEQIKKVILEMYEISPEQAEQDLHEFLHQLMEKGLVEWIHD